MKKIAALLVLCFLCGTAFLFADDASVLPARVGRVYLTPTFAFANGAYDTDGAYQSYDSGKGALKGFLLGAALEYGILDWISAALQWTPGWMAASEVDTKAGVSDNVNVNGVTDLFIGGKFQIVGEKAPVQTSMFRWSLATGVKVPFPGPDYEEQYKNASKSGNEPVTAANQDRHVLGLGLRSYFDYVVNENFYIDLYGEFIGYPMKGKLSESGLTGYGITKNIDNTKAQLANTPLADALSYKDEVDYGFDLTLELEPVYSLPLAEGVRFTAGLPLTYKFSPGKKYDVTVSDMLIAANPAAAALRLEDDDPSHDLSLKPSVAFFFTDFLLPTELKLNYSAPIAGAGNDKKAIHSLTLQVKVYFKI
ncbi:MAG: hypothetical protein LBG10_04245 [Treponema sp.]|jgi:hypothetical protein|nr:hypothetical protein [Treponema sp.]